MSVTIELVGTVSRTKVAGDVMAGNGRIGGCCVEGCCCESCGVGGEVRDVVLKTAVLRA